METEDHKSRDELLLQNLRQIVLENIQNEQFGVEDLAKIYGISRSQLHRKLRKLTKKSISRFIREIRLDSAHKMLREDIGTVSEIAYKVGFSSATYFNTCFSDYFGHPPGEVKIRSRSEESYKLSEMTIPSPRKRILTNQISYWILGILLVVMLAIGIVYESNDGRDRSSTRQSSNEISMDEISMAMLPLKNWTGDPDLDYVSFGITDEVINRLSQYPTIKKIIPFQSIVPFVNSKTSLDDIARELDVHFVVDGNFQKSGDRYKVNIHLVNMLDNQSDTNQYFGEWDSDELFQIQDNVVEAVLELLNVGRSIGQPNSKKYLKTANQKAYNQFLRGKYLMQINLSENRLLESRKYFQEAINLDPEYADAYVWMGITYTTEGTWYGSLTAAESRENSKKYYEKAMSLEPNNQLLMESLAIEKYIFDWNFSEAELLFQNSARLGEHVHACCYLNMQLMLRRFQTVIDEANKALEIDPFSATMYWKLAYAYYHLGKFDKVMNTMEEGLKRNPQDITYYDHFGNLYNALGKFKEAENIISKGLSLTAKRHPSMIANLAISKKSLGKDKQAEQLLTELTQIIEQGKPNSKIYLAKACVGLNMYESALYWLEEAFNDHEVELMWIQVDPFLLRLDHKAEYKALVKAIDFPE